MTSIAASPPWLLAYGGNDDGLQTAPLKEVQLEGRYAPSSGFILQDGLSCQVNVDRYSNRHFLTHLDNLTIRHFVCEQSVMHLKPPFF